LVVVEVVDPAAGEVVVWAMRRPAESAEPRANIVIIFIFILWVKLLLTFRSSGTGRLSGTDA
jgi:hypothetical protein